MNTPVTRVEDFASLLEYVRVELSEGRDLSLTNAEGSALLSQVDALLTPTCVDCGASIDTCRVCDQPIEVAA